MFYDPVRDRYRICLYEGPTVLYRAYRRNYDDALRALQEGRSAVIESRRRQRETADLTMRQMLQLRGAMA